tara:strand:+ start:286 stop:807 length:522 start_codon:yes stop_codon:yes gene_type:complete
MVFFIDHLYFTGFTIRDEDLTRKSREARLKVEIETPELLDEYDREHGSRFNKDAKIDRPIKFDMYVFLQIFDSRLFMANGSSIGLNQLEYYAIIGEFSDSEIEFTQRYPKGEYPEDNEEILRLRGSTIINYRGSIEQVANIIKLSGQYSAEGNEENFRGKWNLNATKRPIRHE